MRQLNDREIAEIEAKGKKTGSTPGDGMMGGSGKQTYYLYKEKKFVIEEQGMDVFGFELDKE